VHARPEKQDAPLISHRVADEIEDAADL